MKLRCLTVAILLGAMLCHCQAAKILGLFQFPGRSHFVMFEALCKALAERGHEVTVLTHWPQKTPLPNYKDVSLEGSMNTFFNNITTEFALTLSLGPLADFLWTTNREMCESVLDHPKTQALIHSEERYDLIITEIFGVDCFLGLAHRWNVPFISMISSSPFPWAFTRVGNPDHPAYMPNYFVHYHAHMTFTQRLWNTVLGQLLSWGKYFYHDIPMQKMSEKYFGPDLPPLEEIAKNTSLILVNTHLSINEPSPLVPAMVQVGGLHIPDPKPLPKDLDRYMSEATQGVVYFSMGSLVRTETFAPEKLQGILDAFSRLEQRVLFKINPETLPPLPNNVLAVRWLPQSDILRHPNTRLFITHGGLMGTQEAVHAGVPMLGIPLFADQHFNIRKCEGEGIAVRLEYEEITADVIFEGINRVLNNDSYAHRAKQLSRLFRDRPSSARDTAVFWTEYVIRHGGAQHLRTHAAHMPTYQYLLLDVIAAIILALFLVFGVIWLAIKMILKLCSKNQSNSSTKVKRN